VIPENTNNLAKKIKINLYGKPQTILAFFPAGMVEAALSEVKSILNNLWFKQKYTSEFTVLKNSIRIEPIHLFAVTELMMRSQSLADIRLIIFEGNASGKLIFKKKCQEIHWGYYFNKNISLKIKVNSVASRAFHESGLKEILYDVLADHVSHFESGDNTDETTNLYVDLYKNKLTISLSLAGQPLYKRGYREVLSASAPLREDAAFCCIDRAMFFAKKINEQYVPDSLIIPFSGTGTFAFEYLQLYFNFSPVLFARDYALTQMPFYNHDNFNFLLKKAREYFIHSSQDITIKCIDNSKNAMTALENNIKNFSQYIENINISIFEEDFFTMNMVNLVEGKNLFLLLNPPYGIRIGKNMRAVDLYKKMAEKINEITDITQRVGKRVAGFILCPDENTWSCFCKNIKKLTIETYHFTQGGLDIRVCQFYG